MKPCTAKDIMRTNLVTIRPDCSLSDAAELLLEHRISGLPVTTQSGKLVGVISEFALLAIAYDRNSHLQVVEDHMTRHVISVDPETPLTKLADSFILHRIRRIPVVEDGKLVGIVSRRELLRSALKAGAPICEHIRDAVAHS